jgi:hypothetical protein
MKCLASSFWYDLLRKIINPQYGLTFLERLLIFTSVFEVVNCKNLMLKNQTRDVSCP